ncbi:MULTISPECIES: TMEM175 family protein [Streptomyces]|uniref:TMEM175 family protein n=1 Tax=Streptomyces TaxID=1883 RepID=UPI002155FACA|nr:MULTISPECIES: TMEM175 family protein [Streptomyces]WPR54674.1 TMEM175 family protein [Streptomyces sp. S399]
MAVGGPARLAALSDGVHAIAMTLLVLGLSLPEGTRPVPPRTARHGAPVPRLRAELHAAGRLLAGPAAHPHTGPPGR